MVTFGRADSENTSENKFSENKFTAKSVESAIISNFILVNWDNFAAVLFSRVPRRQMHQIKIHNNM